MSESEIVFDALKKTEAQALACNKLARELLAELPPFARQDADEILGGDIDRVIALAQALNAQRSMLKDAKRSFDSIKRRPM